MCFVNFILAIIPGVLWMIYIYKSDKFEPEPIGKITLVFLGGFFAVIPVGLIEVGFSGLLGFSGDIDSIFELIGSTWGITGVIEECAKFGVVIFAIYYSKEFDEPVDGIVYASAAALGFASLENFLYMMNKGTAVILIRGPLSTFAHVLFSSMWGYGLGRGKFHPKLAKRLAVSGLILAAGAHGLFNFLLLSPEVFSKTVGTLMALMVLPFVGALWFVLIRQIKKAEIISPFNPNREKDELDKSDRD